MIDCQSSAGVLWPCPSGTFENSPVIYDWVHRSQPTQSPGGTAETILSWRLGVLIAKIRERIPKIRNPLPGSANLCQPLPGPGEGGGYGTWVAPIGRQLRPVRATSLLLPGRYRWSSCFGMSGSNGRKERSRWPGINPNQPSDAGMQTEANQKWNITRARSSHPISTEAQWARIVHH
jgi:hypothetical protein